MSEPLAELSEVERDLVAQAVSSGVVDLKRRTIRGHVLRELLLEMREGWQLPPAGLRVQQAIIDGGLDLEGVHLAKPFTLMHSRIQGGGQRGALVLRDARLRRLGIHACTIEGSITADRATFENGFFIGGGIIKGQLTIRGGEVGGALALEGVEIGDGEQALLGNGVRVVGPLIVRRAKVAGTVQLARSRLQAGIYAEDAEFRHATQAILLESATIGGDLLFPRARITGSLVASHAHIQGRIEADDLVLDCPATGLLAKGCSVGQGIALARARITGPLVLDGAAITKGIEAESLEVDGGEIAITADVIRVGGNWNMKGARLVGQLRCPGATIDGQLRLTEVRIYGSDLAIRADGARVRGGCFMSRALIVGLLRFPAAEVGNQFRLRGATLKVDSGAALLASGSVFHRDVELNRGFETIGGVVFEQCQIRGTCDFRGSHIRSAAIARGGGVPSNAVARDRGEARTIPPADETAISLADSTIHRLQMPQRADERPRGIIDLSRARASSFEDWAQAWPLPVKARVHSADRRDIDHMVLDGFTYVHLANPSGLSTGGMHEHHDDQVGKRRLQWLAGQQACDLAEHFRPQPWVQLTQRLAAQGYDEDAQRIAIARRRGERRSHAVATSSRWQNRLLDWFALYGHNPWRTVLWMGVFIAMFALLWTAVARQCTIPGCHDEEVMVIANRDAYTKTGVGGTYPPFQPLAYSFDLFVPFVSFGYADHWRPNLNYGPIVEVPLPEEIAPSSGRAAVTITWGGILYALSILEMLLGLVLTSLAVTGFTGLLRRGDNGE